jgi:hypothetical protein
MLFMSATLNMPPVCESPPRLPAEVGPLLLLLLLTALPPLLGLGMQSGREDAEAEGLAAGDEGEAAPAGLDAAGDGAAGEPAGDEEAEGATVAGEDEAEAWGAMGAVLFEGAGGSMAGGM